jgi:SAM-dependent methyltransferase
VQPDQTIGVQHPLRALARVGRARGFTIGRKRLPQQLLTAALGRARPQPADKARERHLVEHRAGHARRNGSLEARQEAREHRRELGEHLAVAVGDFAARVIAASQRRDSCHSVPKRLTPQCNGSDTNVVQPKPKHLGREYATQFEDASVARAYHARPPYPDGVLDLLDSLIVDRPRRVLELGAGSGDLGLRLAHRVDALDAVEPSPAMFALASSRQAQPGAPRNVRWYHTSAEAHPFDGPYAGVVAAESLHWMDWPLLFPKLAACLTANGYLFVITVRQLIELPWQPQLADLIARHSTNRDYTPYDIEHELTTRGLLAFAGRQTIIGAPFAQSVDDYVESFHSRNGFSRERMTAAAADAFDRELRALVLAHTMEDVVLAKVTSSVIWGKPLA